MKWNSFKYLINEGISSVFKNKSMSFASISSIIICIFMLGITFCILGNIDHTIDRFEDEINITVYFENDIKEETAFKIKKIIDDSKIAKEVVYISSDVAFSKFIEGGNLKLESEEYLQKIKDDKVLPSSLEVTLFNNKDEKKFVEIIKGLEDQISDVKMPKDVINTLTNLKKYVNITSFVLVGILVIQGIILIGNTIKLTVLLRKDEIKISKYIGATNAFVRLPFIVEGMFIGFIGTTIPLVVLNFMYTAFINMLIHSLGLGIDSLESFRDVSVIFASLVPISYLIGLGMGIIGSMRSMKQHLKV